MSLRLLIQFGLIIVLILLFASACSPSTNNPTTTPEPPVLTDGADTWRLISSDYTSAGELELQFECATGQIPPFPIRPGTQGPDHSKVYITDSQGDQYPVKFFFVISSLSGGEGQCQRFSILFEGVPRESQDHTLYFAELAPVELGQ
jgi:hypothetical protein